MASVTGELRSSRRPIGNPKFGLVLRVQMLPDQMRLSSRPDPLLLYVVLSTTVGVGITGAIATSFHEGIVSFLGFALLFFPMICLLVLNNVRIRSSCVLDKARGVLEIDEQSYTRRVQETYPLRDVDVVAVRMLPNAPLLGTASSFGLFIGMRGIEYLAACSNNETSLSQDAWRVSRFLGVPLETPLGPAPAGRRMSYWRIFAAAAIYLIPTLLTLTALVALFERLPIAQYSFLGLLGAIIVAQVGAILALTYYQSRGPYEG